MALELILKSAITVEVNMLVTVKRRRLRHTLIERIAGTMVIAMTGAWDIYLPHVSRHAKRDHSNMIDQIYAAPCIVRTNNNYEVLYFSSQSRQLIKTGTEQMQLLNFAGLLLLATASAGNANCGPDGVLRSATDLQV
eukprot:3473107-Pleurochrysis_carterae.AAC.1